MHRNIVAMHDDKFSNVSFRCGSSTQEKTLVEFLITWCNMVAWRNLVAKGERKRCWIMRIVEEVKPLYNTWT